MERCQWPIGRGGRLRIAIRNLPSSRALPGGCGGLGGASGRLGGAGRGAGAGGRGTMPTGTKEGAPEKGGAF